MHPHILCRWIILQLVDPMRCGGSNCSKSIFIFFLQNERVIPVIVDPSIHTQFELLEVKNPVNFVLFLTCQIDFEC